MKRWTTVFKALANENRLKIIKLLSGGQALHVGQLTEELDISFKAVSKHLIILQNLDVLESTGRQGHVYYSVNSRMPADISRSVKLIL